MKHREGTEGHVSQTTGFNVILIHRAVFREVNYYRVRKIIYKQAGIYLKAKSISLSPLLKATVLNSPFSTFAAVSDT